MVASSRRAIVIALALLVPSMGIAQSKNQGYLTDTQGNIVRALGAGVCVRTSDWTPARAVAECDPDLVPKPAPPKVVAPPRPKPEAKPEAKPKAKAAPPEKGGGNYHAWYGTNRRPIDRRDESKGYTNQLDTSVHYGKVFVAIPEDYLRQLRKPWWRTIFTRSAEDNVKLLRIDPLAASGFVDQIRKQLAQRDQDERSALIYIHGFNTSFEDAAKRAAAIGFAVGVPVTAFFSWPSTAVQVPTSAAYKADLQEINKSTDEIARFLVKLAQESGAKKLHLVAHSMGNHGLLRALYQPIAQAAIRSGIRFENVILAAPDVDRKTFLKQSAVFKKVARRTTLYVSSGDEALYVSRLVNKESDARVGFGPPVLVVPGIDSISVGAIDLSLLGHSYVATSIDVLRDLTVLIWDNAAPGSPRRFGLRRKEDEPKKVYWDIQ